MEVDRKSAMSRPKFPDGAQCYHISWKKKSVRRLFPENVPPIHVPSIHAKVIYLVDQIVQVTISFFTGLDRSGLCRLTNGIVGDAVSRNAVVFVHRKQNGPGRTNPATRRAPVTAGVWLIDDGPVVCPDDINSEKAKIYAFQAAAATPVIHHRIPAIHGRFIKTFDPASFAVSGIVSNSTSAFRGIDVAHQSINQGIDRFVG